MITQILKTIVAGVLAGVALFMVPFFIIKILVFFLLIKTIFRLLGWRRKSWRGMHPAYAHHYQNMTEEERKIFTEKYGQRCGAYYREKNASDSNKTENI